MKKDIIYLKNYTYGECLTSFDYNKLASVEVYRKEQCSIEKYDTVEDLEERLNRYFKNYDYKLASRTDFNDAFIAFSKNINDLTKEL